MKLVLFGAISLRTGHPVVVARPPVAGTDTVHLPP
jgi:hypothetical protein